jgi:CTP:molybdopterin cytidylyltransferase MocA
MEALDEVAALVLAAGAASDPVAAQHGKPVKGLVEIKGRPLVSYVVEALAAAGCEPVVVVTRGAALGPMRAAVGPRVVVVEAQGERPADTLAAGLAVLPAAGYLLLATADLALLTPAAVRHFLEQARASQAALVYSVCRREAFVPPYNRVPRLMVRLREGVFNGGNLVLVERRQLEGMLEQVEYAFRARKQPVALARLLGLSFVMRLLLMQLGIPCLDLAALVRRGEQLLGCRAAVVVTPYVEVCFDVDKLVDLQVAEEVLEARGAGAQ